MGKLGVLNVKFRRYVLNSYGSIGCLNVRQIAFSQVTIIQHASDFIQCDIFHYQFIDIWSRLK